MYEFLNATDAALMREFAAIGNAPTQSQLDTIGRRFFARHHAARVAEGAHARIADEFRHLVDLFEQDQSTLQNFSDLLGKNAAGISTTTAPSAEFLNNVADVLSSVTGNTIEKAEVVFRQIVESVQAMEQVKSELDQYKRLARIDPLTKLNNRRAFDERLSSIYDVDQTAVSHALLIADIDHFKKLNDTYGHPVGDRVLSKIAAVITESVGERVFVARTGGEEFAIILHGANLAVAVETAENIRMAIETATFRNQKNGVDYGRVTISIGICLATQASSDEEIYSQADIALYKAKQAGRNRHKIYDHETMLETDRR
ncbi:GGDEF domain-containing protein [Hoeflea sp.]|uniref:GGDEF domain-containing protein n=1 Tax=Hoeflea sp. TaxID=1940281 RepID=UPI0025B8E9FB|nr:GGDEF domain-containing protein [Hoeflea sp.]